MKQKIIFLLLITTLLFTIFLAQSQKLQTAKIKSINSQNNKITILLQNKTEELIIFNTNFLNLKINDTIKFQGKNDIYKNKKQIIVNKLYKISK